MRRRFGAGLGLLLVAAASAGCASSPAGVQVERLVGRWDWQSASGGIAGRTITPTTEGYWMELRFLSNGKAELYKSAVLSQTADYQIGVGKKSGSFSGRDVVRFTPPTILGSWEELMLSLPDGSHLLLANGCCDGFTYTFARIGSGP